ncbi:MAG: ArsR family transcriptional regulator [Actinomycetota bacterium]|nr:ArsR family transcriptional regulator [Actinomycetota bacterium]
MDLRLPRAVRAQRHHLLADDSRLAIVEALAEGPRGIPELSRLVGLHRTTVQGHLEKLLAAGVVVEDPGLPGGRGRPSKRYRLKIPILGGDTENRLFVGSLVALLRKAYGKEAPAAAEEEGRERGRELGRSFHHPSLEQTTREVVDTLEHLCFAPTRPVRRNETLAFDLQNCPFRVDPDDPDGPIVCAFHEGIVRGVAEMASGDDVAVRVLPFTAPGLCRVELCSKPATPTRGRRRTPSVVRTAGDKGEEAPQQGVALRPRRRGSSV